MKTFPKKFCSSQCAFAHTVRKWSEKWKILNFFLIFWITIFLTITTQIFVKIGEKIFFDCTVVQKWSEKVRNFFSPILMKFCVVTVKNMVIQNIKKNLKFFIFRTIFWQCARTHTVTNKIFWENFSFSIKIIWCEFEVRRSVRSKVGF